ncbi:MAG: hypothetical protein WAL63_21865 [Solirubrobacteraceae bacterium]
MLFSGRRRWVAVDDLSEADRHEYARLLERRVLDLDRGIYRASHVALYGNYQLPAPPISSLTNEGDDSLTSTGNPADICVGLHTLRR